MSPNLLPLSHCLLFLYHPFSHQLSPGLSTPTRGQYGYFENLCYSRIQLPKMAGTRTEFRTIWLDSNLLTAQLLLAHFLFLIFIWLLLFKHLSGRRIQWTFCCIYFKAWTLVILCFTLSCSSFVGGDSPCNQVGWEQWRNQWYRYQCYNHIQFSIRIVATRFSIHFSRFLLADVRAPKCISITITILSGRNCLTSQANLLYLSFFFFSCCIPCIHVITMIQHTVRSFSCSSMSVFLLSNLLSHWIIKSHSVLILSFSIRHSTYASTTYFLSNAYLLQIVDMTFFLEIYHTFSPIYPQILNLLL